MSVWSGVLDSCPGLLCCVINIRGKLLYATHGYKSVAGRLFGHKCEEGRNYPPRITELDSVIHEALMAACLGDTNAIEIAEGEKLWELTASPLILEENGTAGVVIRITQKENAQPLPPVIQSNPEILEALPFRAGVVDSHGVFLAANKFLMSCVRGEITGRNVIELIEPEDNSALMNIIMKRSGSVECRMHEIQRGKNFYEFSEEVFFDEDLNTLTGKIELEYRQIVIHSTPIEWSGKPAVLLTFEDITEHRRTREQLRRVLTFDDTTGVLNRRGIIHVIRSEIVGSIKNTEHLSLIMMSIDDIGEISGRDLETAERTLREFVRIMKRTLSGHKNFSAGRFDFGEFAVIAHCSGASAVVLANEIREKLTGVAVSSGVAELIEGGYSGTGEFISAAYNAMNEARRKGINQTVLAKKS